MTDTQDPYTVANTGVDDSGAAETSPKSIGRNVLAVVVGFVLGSAVNMGLVTISSSVIPLPEGVDPTDMESLKANIASFPLKNFIMPFLAHALGTLVGAFVAAKLAVSHKKRFAMGIGAFFMLGGIFMAISLPAPLWFEAFDVIVAYLPMGWLGWVLAGKSKA